MRFFGILLCFLSVAAWGAPPQNLPDRLRAEFQTGVKSLPADTSAEDLQQLARIESMLSETWSEGPGDRVRTGGRYSEVIEALMGLEATTRSAKVDDFCETFLTEMRSMIAEVSKEFRKSFLPTVREAFATGLAATSPKEIDAPLLTLIRLQKLQTDLEGSHSEILQVTLQILTTYQNGLLGLVTSHGSPYGSPANDLDNFASSPMATFLFEDVMPRSEFMKKMRAAEAKAALAPGHPQKLSAPSTAQAITDVINGIQTLDAMAPAVIRIDALKDQLRQQHLWTVEGQPESLLRYYFRTYEHLRTDGTSSMGDLRRILQLPTTPDPSLEGQPIAKLRDALFRYALPRVLGAPPDLAPREDESTADFLRRARATARTTANWKLYYNLLLYATEQGGSQAYVAAGAFRSFMAAINLEKATQYREAVKSYQSALAMGAEDIPLDYIREHLEAIRRDFPEAFANAAATTPAPAHAVAPSRHVSSQTLPVPPNKISPTVENLRYAGRHERQVLDFYQAKSDRPTPLLFYIHGGSWARGNKNNPDELQTFLDAGISVVSINYRFIADAMQDGIQPPLKAPLEDAARALQFVRSKAKEWNIDKQCIGAVGGSPEGASASLWLAFHPDMADPHSSDPISQESTRLWCAAALASHTTLDPQQIKEWATTSIYGFQVFGFISFEDDLLHRDQVLPWIAEYSPYALVTQDDPPVFLAYKTLPTTGQPPQGLTYTPNYGVKLQEKCRQLGVSCELVILDTLEVKQKEIIAYLLDKLKTKAK